MFIHAILSHLWRIIEPQTLFAPACLIIFRKMLTPCLFGTPVYLELNSAPGIGHRPSLFLTCFILHASYKSCALGGVQYLTQTPGFLRHRFIRIYLRGETESFLNIRFIEPSFLMKKWIWSNGCESISILRILVIFMICVLLVLKIDCFSAEKYLKTYGGVLINNAHFLSASVGNECIGNCMKIMKIFVSLKVAQMTSYLGRNLDNDGKTIPLSLTKLLSI